MRADYETIIVSRYDDQIPLVALDRPEVSNALNTRMGLNLMEFFEALSIDLQGLRGGHDRQRQQGVSAPAAILGSATALAAKSLGVEPQADH
jgi:hypothetical protein